MPRALIPLLLLCLLLLPASARQPEPNSNYARAEAAFRSGDFAAAIDLYRAARADGLDHALLHFRLGYSLHVTGQVEAALPHHLRGVSINDRAIRIDCLYNAACASALLGRPDDAFKYLQHAIDAGFQDKPQVARDTDLDTLRADPRFTSLIDSIGVTPTLYEQLDFLIGVWTLPAHDDDEPDARIVYTFERPSPLSAAINYTMHRDATFAWAGSIIPNPIDRTWELTYCNHIGTTYRLIGSVEGDTITFEGRSIDIGGQGPRVRITYTRHDDGTLTENVQVATSDDEWTLHHEETLRPVPPSAT